MKDDEDHERRVETLFNADATFFKSWVEQMRASAKDGQGRTVLLGMTAAETIEFLELNLQYALAESGPLDDVESEVRRDRYDALRDQLHAAISKDAGENFAHWRSEMRKH